MTARKVLAALAGILIWYFVIVVAIGLFQNCVQHPPNPCPADQVFVADPGSPFGDGECEDG